MNAGPPYAHVVSVGESCVPAARIGIAGLRTRSFPFDWAASNPVEVARFVRVGAEAWFAERDAAAPDADPALASFANPRTHWPHRDGEDMRAYVVRCWTRLHAAMDSASVGGAAREDRRVLLLHYTPLERDPDEMAVVSIANSFRARWPDLPFDLLTCSVRVRDPQDERVDDVVVYREHRLTHTIRMYMARFDLRAPWCEETGGWDGRGNDALWERLFAHVGLTSVTLE